ncbi:MAG: universal stress protein [Myxococcales bacterium]|nr:universal stress protein [Myxococcales bacterium]
MLEIERVVVGVDFSIGSRSALTQAAHRARGAGAELVVLHVIDRRIVRELAMAMRMSKEAVEQMATERAHEQLRQWLGDGAESAHSRVVVGYPSDELLAAIDGERQLLVLGLSGGSGRGPGAGALAAMCARRCHAPVLVVDDRHDRPFSHVVGCVDLSAAAPRIARWALATAAADQANVDLLHVYRPPWRNINYRTPTQTDPELKQRYVAGLEATLREINEQAVSTDAWDDTLPHDAVPEVRRPIVAANSIGVGIVEHVARCAADLLVIGRRGRIRLRHLPIGTTAERILRALPCSVLVIPSSARDAL